MGKRFAVAVGINDYTEYDFLKYCVKDAEDVLSVFIDMCNVEDENVRLISSEKKQPNNNPWLAFCEVIDGLKCDFNPGVDDIFFYFSGHGVYSNETTVVFKNRTITITEINDKLTELRPKTKILIFDSCYSGIGLAESNKSATLFAQSTNFTSGYFILCACSDTQTAKESRDLSNGRFTSFLVTTIRDLNNYNQYKQLDVNALFSKVDLFFKSNSDFNQNPVQQIKSIGSYPIANCFNKDLCYVRYDIEDLFDSNWSEIVHSLSIYLNTYENVIGEFSRLVREHYINTADKSKGNAKQYSVEISIDRVLLIDDGNFFDLLNPIAGIKKGGGILTANQFKNQYGVYFEYSCSIDNGRNYYSFNFRNVGINEICTMNIDMSSLRKLEMRCFTIDEKCVDFTIRFDKFVMMLSLIHTSINSLLKESKRTNKKIYMEFAEGDYISKEVESMIEMYGASDYIKVRTYSV